MLVTKCAGENFLTVHSYIVYTCVGTHVLLSMFATLCRSCYVIKPKQWTPGRTTDTYQRAHRSHVIAFPNVDAKLLDRVLTPIDRLPELIQVVFLTMSSDKKSLADIAKERQVKALHVRGKVVADWAKYLCTVSTCACNNYE